MKEIISQFLEKHKMKLSLKIINEIVQLPTVNKQNILTVLESNNNKLKNNESLINELVDELIKYKISEINKYTQELNALDLNKDRLISVLTRQICTLNEKLSEKDSIIKCQLELIQQMVQSNLQGSKGNTQSNNTQTSTNTIYPCLVKDDVLHLDTGFTYCTYQTSETSLDRYAIKGKTYDIRDILKEYKGSWDKTLQVWHIPKNNLGPLFESLVNYPVSNPSESGPVIEDIQFEINTDDIIDQINN
jgi:hypothetical protein